MRQESIAILTTGDEIIQGDILNRNTQAIASFCQEHGFQLGNQLSCSDDQADLEHCMQFLLAKHKVLITTGGLGPTSDDRTRFALANVIGKSLVFDDNTWQHLIQRAQKLNYDLPESNRQQALFPEGGIILDNPQGTAAGCAIEHAGQWIFMLPGPPRECLPMFQDYVLPLLQQHLTHNHYQLKKWLVFEITESKLGMEFDKLMADYPCVTGYRFCYPYIEVKLRYQAHKQINAMLFAAENFLAPLTLTNSNQTASEALVLLLQTLKQPITICDDVTQGHLQAKLIQPETKHIVKFTHDHNADFVISGLDEFWQASPNTLNTELILKINYQNVQQTIRKTLTIRHRMLLEFVIEFVCGKLLQTLTTTL